MNFHGKGIKIFAGNSIGKRDRAAVDHNTGSQNDQLHGKRRGLQAVNGRMDRGKQVDDAFDQNDRNQISCHGEYGRDTGAVAGLKIPGQKDEVVARRGDQAEAEKGKIGIHSDRVSVRIEHQRRDERGRDCHKQLNDLEHDHSDVLAGHDIVPRDGKHGGQLVVVAGLRGIEGDEYGKDGIADADKVGILRDQQHERQQRKQIDARHDDQPQLLVQNILHDFAPS